PNSAGFPSYIFNAPSQNDFDRFAGRIDYNPSNTDSFMVRIGHQSNPILTPGPVPGAGTGVVGNLLEGRNLGVTWNHFFSGQTFNEARFSYAKLLQEQLPSEFFGQNLAKEFGFANGDRTPKGIWGCPRLGFSGVSTNGLCSP